MKKLFIGTAMSAVLFILMYPNAIFAQKQPNMAKEKELRIERSIPEAGVACIQCHKQKRKARAYLPTGQTVGMPAPILPVSTVTRRIRQIRM